MSSFKTLLAIIGVLQISAGVTSFIRTFKEDESTGDELDVSLQLGYLLFTATAINGILIKLGMRFECLRFYVAYGVIMIAKLGLYIGTIISLFNDDRNYHEQYNLVQQKVTDGHLDDPDDPIFHKYLKPGTKWNYNIYISDQCYLFKNPYRQLNDRMLTFIISCMLVEMLFGFAVYRAYKMLKKEKSEKYRVRLQKSSVGEAV